MKRLARLFKIFMVFSKYRLDEFIDLAPLPAPLRALLLIAPWRFFPVSHLPRGERLRLALEDLGPVFIKFGQMLSTRRDLLPDDIADELQRLQDQVPPFPGEQAIALIESQLGQSLTQLFTEFKVEPLASASVAQVHSATLPNGDKVVVKVIRPGIDQIIDRDLDLLFILAKLAERYSADGRRLRPIEVVADYRRTIFNELDLLIEAGNTSQLRRNFTDSPLLYVPQVYFDYTRQSVLVMERIHGIPVADIPALKAAGIDMKKLAERGVEIFFTQVFRDSFFHADMHPGNIFVSTENPENPQYIAIDCGIIGTLTKEDKNYLALLLLAFFKRNYRRVAEIHLESGWVPEDTPVGEFETAVRAVCEPVFEKPLKDISFGQVLLRLFQTARQFNMEVQPQLVLLQKTLLNIEGLGRQIYPDLDLWHTALPFMEDWMRERSGAAGIIHTLREHGPELLEHSSELPHLVVDSLQQLRQWQRQHDNQQQAMMDLQEQLARSHRSHKHALLGLGSLGLAGLIASGSIAGAPISSFLLAALGLYFIIK